CCAPAALHRGRSVAPQTLANGKRSRLPLRSRTGVEVAKGERRSLVLLRRGTGGEFPEQSEHCAGRFLVREAVKTYGGGEVRRGLIEAHVHEFFVAAADNGIDHRSQLHGPVFLSGENHRARPRDHPSAGWALGSRLAGPAVTHDIEMKARRKTHVGFEGERFLLPAQP